MEATVAIICYTKHRGETALRRIRPYRLFFGSCAWHPEGQWLLEAFDMDKRAVRLFALASIHHWQSARS